MDIIQQKIEEAKTSKSLDLSQMGLTELPKEVFEIRDLQALSAKKNLIRELPNDIARLTELRFLNLKDNRLEGLPSEFVKLSKLEHLNLSRNSFKHFPAEILQLTHLRRLFLGQNELKEIPQGISQLQNLQTLFVQKTLLTALPDTTVNLPLIHLNIDNNKLIVLPENISNLNTLISLTARGNLIEELPRSISDLLRLKKIVVKANPLRKPPLEICMRGIKAVREYFADLEQQGEEYIYEAKLILIGEPAAGKTTLAEKLLNPNYQLNPTEPMTKGIVVRKWDFPFDNDITFRANIWDFGGQEIMHATHRYFLTKRSLYMLVADNRKEDTDFYYWLKMIELFGANSPVLIVLNEKDDHKKYVSADILKSFKCIRGVYAINLSDNRGLADLTLAIQNEMVNLPHVGKEPIPRKWVEIRQNLENEKENYISRGSYLQSCYKAAIGQSQALRISEFLHDLGVILHFQSDRVLRNTLILNTSWATEAVYLILFDENIIKNAGKFNNTYLDSVWNASEYVDKHAHLLQLMINFELCYEIGTSQEYIVPQLLPEKPHEYSWDNNENLLFQYLYTFMPKGIISRLIVRMNRYIFNQLQWKSGVVLRIEDATAELKEDYFQKILKIRISGEDKRECLAIIRKELHEIHESFETEPFVYEMVPCVCSECKTSDKPHFYKYEVLKKYASKGKLQITCERSIDDVSVNELLSGIIDVEGNNALQILGNIRGTLFEQVIEKLLSIVYPATNIERGRKLRSIENGTEEEYEYDFIVTNHRQKEIIIIEVKGYYKQKKIKLGDRNTRETVQWFFGRTFPFAKAVLPNPNNYLMRGCYVTFANFEDEAQEFLETQNNTRIKSSTMDVYYDNSKLIGLLRTHGLLNEIKDLKRYFSK